MAVPVITCCSYAVALADNGLSLTLVVGFLSSMLESSPNREHEESLLESCQVVLDLQTMSDELHWREPTGIVMKIPLAAIHF